jgi:hypothetical protein
VPPREEEPCPDTLGEPDGITEGVGNGEGNAQAEGERLRPALLLALVEPLKMKDSVGIWVADGEELTKKDTEPQALAEPQRLPEGDTEMLADRRALAVGETLRMGEGEGEGLLAKERLRAGEVESVVLPLLLLLRPGLLVEERLRAGEEESVALPLTLVLRLGLRVMLPHAVLVGDADAQRVMVAEPVPQAVTEGEGVTDAVRVAVAHELGEVESLRVPEEHPDTAPEREGETVRVAVTHELGEMESLREPEEHPDTAPEREDETVLLGDSVEDREREGDAEKDGELLPPLLRLPDRVVEGDAEAHGEAAPVRVGEGVTEGLNEAVGQGEPERVLQGEGEGERERLGDAVWEGEPEPHAVRDGDRDSLGDPVAERLMEDDTEALTEPVARGDGAGVPLLRLVGDAETLHEMEALGGAEAQGEDDRDGDAVPQDDWELERLKEGDTVPLTVRELVGETLREMVALGELDREGVARGERDADAVLEPLPVLVAVALGEPVEVEEIVPVPVAELESVACSRRARRGAAPGGGNGGGDAPATGPPKGCPAPKEGAEATRGTDRGGAPVEERIKQVQTKKNHAAPPIKLNEIYLLPRATTTRLLGT